MKTTLAWYHKTNINILEYLQRKQLVLYLVHQSEELESEKILLTMAAKAFVNTRKEKKYENYMSFV